MARLIILLLLLSLLVLLVDSRLDPAKVPTMPLEDEQDFVGTRWALLIAGSSGYENYRHQADVCHAYQVLKNGGLKDENIVVFMYDDIAYNEENPRPGVIINQPEGKDVYAGVPKDYVGEDVNVNNFFAALLGNKSALIGGGSGKVIESGPDDHIFIYYTDHGGAGVLGMPMPPDLYADDLNAALKKKHAAKSYKSMVIYIEACYSGSMFEGLLSENMNIYATTAANAKENSFGTYCPWTHPSPPDEYSVCVGDLYSVSWLEDSDVHDMAKETLEEQYQIIKERISVNGTYVAGSHAMQYGDLDLSSKKNSLYFGSNHRNVSAAHPDAHARDHSLPTNLEALIDQRDDSLAYFWHKVQRAPEGSTQKLEAKKQLDEVMKHRSHIDSSIRLIGKLLFGNDEGLEILDAVRPAGQPLVDDWVCFKSMVRSFETYCGSLSQYGMKHMRKFANICNAGVKVETMEKLTAKVCLTQP